VRGRLAVLAVLLAILPAPAIAQDGEWPTRTVRLIVASGPGGNPDVLARLLAEKFGSKFGKRGGCRHFSAGGGCDRIPNQGHSRNC
jgi:tripartite-type tricarboxylate transporter receptor subunit TctC